MNTVVQLHNFVSLTEFAFITNELVTISTKQYTVLYLAVVHKIYRSLTSKYRIGYVADAFTQLMREHIGQLFLVFFFSVSVPFRPRHAGLNSNSNIFNCLVCAEYSWYNFDGSHRNANRK